MGGMSPLMTYMLMRGADGQRNDDHRNGRIDDRFKDWRGREHYDDGRFAPMRSAYDGGMRSEWDHPVMGYVEPIRMNSADDDDDYRRKWTITEANGYGHMEPEHNGNGMRQVMGFAGSSVEHHRMDEMSHRSGDKSPGHASSRGRPMLTREMADEWMASLKNADGTRGPHWTFDEVKNLMQTRGIQGNPLLLWVGMNAEYSDAVMLNRKYGLDRPEYYLDAAVTRWANDKDAVADKAAAYYMYVVKH